MATATQTSKILSAEQEAKLRQPIDEYVGKIQAQIDELRTDGTEKAVNIQNELDNLKRDRIYTAQEKTERETKLKAELAAAKAVEEKNKGQINKLIADAEAYLKAHYDSDYYQAVVASCKQEKVQAQQKYQATVEQLKKEHETALSKLSNQQEIKDEKYVHKNRLFDAKMQLDKDCQAIKDRRHAAFDYKYHLIDMLRLSKFTVGESLAQKWENYKYTFNRRDFFAAQRSVHCNRYHLYYTVPDCPVRQESAAAYRQQYFEHSAAGFAAHVPGFGRCRADPAGRHGPVHWPYGWYGHDCRYHHYAQGNQHRCGFWPCV